MILWNTPRLVIKGMQPTQKTRISRNVACGSIKEWSDVEDHQ